LRDATVALKTRNLFTIARDLTLLGYFSSEIGFQAREYLPIPGRYDGSADYTPGQKLGLLEIFKFFDFRKNY
jgi:hypothetical protein